jgi:hypothetical protein
MSNVVVTIFVFALMLVAVMTWSQVSFGSLDSGAQALKQLAETATEVARTDIEVVDAQEEGAFVEIYVRNSGEIRLAQFHDWDVITHHYDGAGDYYINRLTYTEDSDPGDQEWTVADIYTDDGLRQSEVYEPGILNPGEVMFIKLKLSPAAGKGTTNWAIVSSYNGVVASAQFAG